MKAKILGLLAVGLLGATALVTPRTASATSVTYSTTGSQLCVGASGCGVATQTIGGNVTVTFSPIASSTVIANPTTFGSFGEIIVSCVGGGTGCGNSSLSGLNLFINITQSLPVAGAGSLSGGAITGAISGTASSALITWAVPNGISIGTIFYEVLNNPLALVPPSVNNGVTSVGARITARTAPVPEPGTLALLGLGLAGLGLSRRRKSH